MDSLDALSVESVNNLDKMLEKAYSEKDKEKLKDLCNQFESLMLSQIFKKMKNSGFKSDLIPKGLADDIFNDMFIDEISKTASQNGGIGLGKMLYDSMLRQIENKYKIKEQGE